MAAGGIPGAAETTRGRDGCSLNRTEDCRNRLVAGDALENWGTDHVQRATNTDPVLSHSPRIT